MPNGTSAAKAITDRLLLITICLPVFSLLFFTGCSREQEAVDLYVDAIILTELDEDELAIEKLNSAVRVNKRFYPAYSLLGEIYQEIKDYKNSAAAYEKATELNTLSFKDFFNLGRVYQILREFALAVKAYVEACELRPERSHAHLYPKAHFHAAESYFELKDYDKALVYAQRAGQMDPNLSEVQKLLADIYDSRRDYEQAIRSYERSLEIDANDPNVVGSLAIAYLNTGRYEPAKELLADVVRIQPDNNTAHQYLGYCYLQLNDVDKAIESYNRAIAINDKDWQAFRGLGVAYMFRALSSRDESLKARAVQHWRISLAINPNQNRREKLMQWIRKYSK